MASGRGDRLLPILIGSPIAVAIVLAPVSAFTIISASCSTHTILVRASWTLATCALAVADSAGGPLAAGEALAKAAAPSAARVVELALDSLVATSTP